MQAQLIVGGAGFLGSAIARDYIQRHRDRRLLLLDNLGPNAHPATLAELVDHDQIIFVAGDVRNTALLVDLIVSHGITHIVQCTADARQDRYHNDAALGFENIVLTTLALLDGMRLAAFRLPKQQALAFHYVSGADVYGYGANGHIGDASIPSPTHYGAAALAAAENYIMAFAQQSRVRTTLSRPTHIFGTHQFPDRTVAAFATALLMGKRVPLYGTGQALVNLIDSMSVASVINVMIQREDMTGSFGMAGKTMTLKDVALQISQNVDRLFAADPTMMQRFPLAPAAKGMASSSLLTTVNDRRQTERPRDYYFHDLEQTIGVGVMPFQEALAATISWYAAHPRWWQSILNDSYRTHPAPTRQVG